MARIILIVAALVMAGATAFFLNRFLQGQEDQVTEGEQIPQVVTVEVLVASRELGAGTIVSADDFQWQGWPEDAVNENYIVNTGDAALEEIYSSAVKRAISAGEPVTRAKLVRLDEAGFLAAVLGPGMRAVSILVTPDSGAAGFILPGSRVDVVLTQEIDQDRGGGGAAVRQVISETVLSDIRVLAVDQDFNDVQESARLGETVTLEVSSAQAEKISAARRMGELNLSLRSLVRDEERERTGTFTSGDDVSSYLNRQASTTRRALVAARDLPPGTLLRDIDMRWIELPTGTETGEYIIEAYADLPTLRGALLSQAVAALAPIREKQLVRPGQQGFILRALSPGMRAVSIQLEQVTGVSGYTSPGDLVDVILTHEVDDTSENPVFSPRRFAETIISNVRLLALEQTVDPQTGRPQQGQSATLEVTARQAEALALGAAMGNLSLALRSETADNERAQDGRLPFTSDLSTSAALTDFLTYGTLGAPELQERPDATFRDTDARLPGSASPRTTVRIYRAGEQSEVTVSPKLTHR